MPDAGALDATDLSFNRSEWASAYRNAVEHPDGFWLTDWEGAVPPELEGSLYRNGPGLFQHGDDWICHPFDGHGLVACVSFLDGKAFFRSRFVRTAAYKDESSAQRLLYRGAFGTQIPGGWWRNFCQLSFRNPANTGLADWGGKLLALFESGHMHSMDPYDLSTKGPEFLDGKLEGGVPFSTGWQWLDWLAGLLLCCLGFFRNLPEGAKKLGGEAVCAHPVHDPTLQHLLLFSCCFAAGTVQRTFSFWGRKWTLRLPGITTVLKIREFDEAFNLVSLVERRLPGYCFLHDMSITERRYVFISNPVKLRMLPLLAGMRCPVQCIEWRGTPSEVLLIPRPTRPANASLSDQALPEGAKFDSVTANGRALRGGAEDEPDGLRDESSGPCNESSGCGSTGREILATHRQRRLHPHRRRNLRVRDDSASELSQQPLQAGKSQAGALEERRNGVTPSTDSSYSEDLVVDADPAFIFHHANAFESPEGGRVMVDCVRYPFMPQFGQEGGKQRFVDWVDPMTQPISQLWRYTMDLGDGSAKCEVLSSRAAEFPAINPSCTGRQHRYLFASAALNASKNGPQQALLKLDTVSGHQLLWSQGPHMYAGEPIFVPKAGTVEDAGWLLSICYDAAKQESLLVIVDAASMQKVGCAGLRHSLPHGLHGFWSNDYTGPTSQSRNHNI